MRGFLCAGVMAFALSACAGATPWNPQGYAGINQGRVIFTDDGTPQEIIVVGGKESSQVELSGEFSKGAYFAYKAKDTRAFPGHELRAAVERAVSADVRDATPGIVDMLLEVIETVWRDQ